MRNVVVIFEREFLAYFNGALAYIIIPVFLLMVGAFSLFFRDVFSMEIVTMRPVYFWCSLSFLLLIPALTMRAFAEEMRTGSFEFPLCPFQRSKWFLVSTWQHWPRYALTLTLTYPYTLSQVSELDMGRCWGGMLVSLWAPFQRSRSASASTQSSHCFVSALLIGLIPFALGYALTSAPAPLLLCFSI